MLPSLAKHDVIYCAITDAELFGDGSLHFTTSRAFAHLNNLLYGEATGAKDK